MWLLGLAATIRNIRIDSPLSTRPLDATEREYRSRFFGSATAGSLHSQPEQGKHFGEIDEPLRLFPLRSSQRFATVLAFQEFLESAVNSGRQAKSRQIIRNLQLNRNHLWHVISSIQLHFGDHTSLQPICL
jgi:hypothetical protein